MRLSLLGFNLLAFGALVVPALLLFDSASAEVGPWAKALLAAFVAGAACLVAAMARLSGKRVDAPGGMGLLFVGAGLLAGPIVVLVSVSLSR
jgi:hypothetical protein